MDCRIAIVIFLSLLSSKKIFGSKSLVFLDNNKTHLNIHSIILIKPVIKIENIFSCKIQSINYDLLISSTATLHFLLQRSVEILLLNILFFFQKSKMLGIKFYGYLRKISSQAIIDVITKFPELNIFGVMCSPNKNTRLLSPRPYSGTERHRRK